MIGVVLAAGRGRRMGQPKATLEFKGSPLAWHVASRLLDAGLERVVVALREPVKLPPGADAFLVPDPDGEALDTLRQVRAAAGPGPLVLLPVDCPMVQVGTIRRLIDAYEAPFIKPTFQGRGGHPVIFDVPLLGGESLREILQAHDGRRLEVDDPGILQNWNHPEDVRTQA